MFPAELDLHLHFFDISGIFSCLGNICALLLLMYVFAMCIL